MNSAFSQFFELLIAENIVLEDYSTLSYRSFTAKLAKVSDWERLANITKKLDYRLASLWAEDDPPYFRVFACLEYQGNYLLLITQLPHASPKLASFSNAYPAANRLERHAQDLLGIEFLNSPDTRRWTRHLAWEENFYPLRKNVLPREEDTRTKTTLCQKNLAEAISLSHDKLSPNTVPSDASYPFKKILGSDICEVPVGPVHAGIIEPGHFRFSIAGEDILKLEERLGYTHKGIEKLAEGKSIAELLRLAARVSGDSTVAHAWAAALALENAAHMQAPERASHIRAICAERERIANHLWDIGAICNDVGFAFAYYQFGRLRELWQQLNHKLFGHRFMRDIILLGGVKYDLDIQGIDAIQKQMTCFHHELAELGTIINHRASLQDRLATTGILSPSKARELGAVGYVGKASGEAFDVRKDAPYAPYDTLSITIPFYTTGDVAARLQVRLQETFISLKLIQQLLETLPKGNIQWDNLPKLNHQEGIASIEGFRGEIISYVKLDNEGKVARYFTRDPSWFLWPTLEQLIHGTIIPDFPVCNKSVNASYAGVDL